MAPTVSIKPDELLVDDGSPSSPGHATFTVSLDQASTSDLTFNVKLNPPSQTLDSAQEAPVDSVTINSATNTTTSKFTKGEFVAFTSQFKILAGSTSATVDVALRGDTLVEPNEQFSIQIEPTAGENVVMAPGTVIGKNGAPIPGSAIGTILGDGNLATNVTPTFSQTALTALDPTLIPLLTADLQAAAARIEIALGDTVPKFDIQVTTGDLGGPYAKCHPVQTDYTKINGQKVFLPNTLVEHLKGTDPNGTTPDINLTLSTNSQDGVSTWFSGHSQVDVTTMLTHELLHGIGFGAGWSSTPFAGTSKSIWDTFVSSPHGQYVFNGPQAHRVPLATDDNGQLNGHVANLPDLMDPFVGASLPNGMFDEPISPLDVAMLNDIGYGIAPPEWFHPQNPRLIAGVAPDLPPLASTLPAQDGMQGAATYQMTQDTNSAQLNQSVLNLAQSIASFGAARSTSADSFATTLSASAQSMDPILAMPHLHAAV